jgi:hypothetical protein
MERRRGRGEYVNCIGVFQREAEGREVRVRDVFAQLAHQNNREGEEIISKAIKGTL